jgi:hypothetical protein
MQTITVLADKQLYLDIFLKCIDGSHFNTLYEVWLEEETKDRVRINITEGEIYLETIE